MFSDEEWCTIMLWNTNKLQLECREFVLFANTKGLYLSLDVTQVYILLKLKQYFSAGKHKSYAEMPNTEIRKTTAMDFVGVTALY